MEWLNHNHLYYFWLVAREGNLSRACAKMRLAPSTVSAQIHALEHVLDIKLFARNGRNLSLTESGKVVFSYAEDIFTLSQELQDTLKGRPAGRSLSLRVGVADVLPKFVAFRLLTPVFNLGEPVRLICQDYKSDKLLAQLALHELDVVLIDAPVPPAARIRAFNHLLGESTVSFMASKAIVSRCKKNFPRSLDGQPFLLPTRGTMLRQMLDQWFDTHGIRPEIAGEFDDSALLKVFGQAGMGILAVPSVSEKEVKEHYGLQLLGPAEGVVERFYAVSPERKIKHPAVAAICNSAQSILIA